MAELSARYGGADGAGAIERADELLGTAASSAALRAIPMAPIYGEDAVDDDGLDDTPLVVKAAVTVAGETIAVDYAGTCGQVRRNLNCPWASTVSATLAAIKAALTSPDIPFNEGLQAADRRDRAEGHAWSIRYYPAPRARGGLLPATRCFHMPVLKALAQVVPDQVIARAG